MASTGGTWRITDGARAFGMTVAAWMLRALGRSWRVRVEGPDAVATRRPGPAVIATWHRNILIGAALYRDRGFSVTISRSRDGDWIAGIVVRLGWASPPRGSSSRGATSVLRESIRRVRSGAVLAVPCDGPRGPARRAKTGAIALAGVTGVSATPVAFSAGPCFRVPSWDGTLVPWPFAKVVVRWGDPLPVPEHTTQEERDRARALLERKLNTLTDEIDGRLGLSLD